MLIEQAFLSVPEILVGSGYPSQQYEAGLVGAFCLALLQELNGRNVANPLSCLQTERPFRDAGFTDPSGLPRYLRCDLHVNLGRTRLGTNRLSRYGFRHSNWVEAKFFRLPRTDPNSANPPTRSTNTSTNQGYLLADLIRVCTLVDNSLVKNGRSYAGRYLLHIYENNHDAHLGSTRSHHRGWLTNLLAPGPQKIARFSVANQIKTIQKVVGTGLVNLELEAAVTNFVLGPLSASSAERGIYICVLTRIDAFNVSLNGASWSVSEAREQTEVPAEQGFATIRDAVGTHISIRDAAEVQAPTPDEVPQIDPPEDAEPAGD